MIDLDELRGLARETGSDNNFYAPADEDNAAMLYEAADEIERLRASELALKKELLRKTKLLLGNYEEALGLIDMVGGNTTHPFALVEKTKDRIQQLEQEIQESGSWS